MQGSAFQAIITYRTYQKRLAWLRFREQAFHLLLVSPALLLLGLFFLVPVLTMLVRSFQDGPLGLKATAERAVPLPQEGPGVFRVEHIPLTDANGDRVVDPADVRALAVRPVRARALEAKEGLVALEEVPLPSYVLVVSYNDVEREVVLSEQMLNAYVFSVRKPPVRDRDGDGQVTTADLRIWLERKVVVAGVERNTGRVTLEEPLLPGEYLLMTYRYREPVTLEHYRRMLLSRGVWNWAVWRPSLFRDTFAISLFTTVGAILLGYPVAYVLARASSAWRTALLALVIVPLWTNILIRTFAWRVILGWNGLVNDALVGLGVVDEPLKMVFNRFGLYVVMVHVLLPYLILPVFAVMRGIADYPLQVAASLGATPARAFLRVYLPMTLPGVAAGALLVFILSLGLYIIPLLMGGPTDRMASNAIVGMTSAGAWETGSAMAVLLLLATVVLYWLFTRFFRLEGLYGDGEREGGRLWGLFSAGWLEEGAGSTNLALEAVRRPLHRAVWGWAKAWRGLQDGHLWMPQPLLGVVTLIGGVALLTAMGRWVYQAPPPLLGVGLVVAGGIGVVAVVLSRLTRLSPGRLAVTMVAGLVFVFLILPNIIVVIISFEKHPVFLTFPGSGFTLDNFAAYFGVAGASHYGRGGWIQATITSLEVAVAVVAISVPVGSLASYGLVRGRFPGKALVTYFLVSPLIVPVLITAVALYMFFARHMPYMIGTVANLGPFTVPLGFVAGHTVLAIPFVIVILSATLTGVEPILERASMSLGAGRFTTLRRVVFPLMLPGMVAAAFFAFLVSFDELFIALFLSTPEVMTLPKRIWDGIRFEVDPTISAIGSMLVFLTLLVLSSAAVSQWLLWRRTRGRA